MVIDEDNREQKMVLSMVNSHEGDVFVDQTTAATVQIPNYVANLFPNLGAQDITAAAQLYQGLGSNIEQANLIAGECEFVPQLIRGLKPRLFSLRSHSRLSQLLSPQSFQWACVQGALPSF
jgi:hypothetical protein